MIRATERPLLWMTLMAMAAVCVLGASPATATPIYSIRSANACDTCHVEPLGWANPDQADRLCTLDCNGCHYSPTGGGLRTPTGQYYGRQTVAMFGTRPGDFADSREFLPEGYPDKGRYRLNEGFSGWWAGNKPMAEIKDRFGDMEADPMVRAGFDIRAAVFSPINSPDPDAETAIFPMQVDGHLMVRPMDNLVLYSSLGLQGSTDLEYETAADYILVRELFVKLDRLPYNSYVRAGRFTPPYGWRVPDHTTMVREPLDFVNNQYQVFGVEGGYNPNYFFTNVAAFAQGLEQWPGDVSTPGFGVATTTGWRDLGYQIFGSARYLNRTADGAFDEATLGLGWGVNLYPFTYIGEVDYRRQFNGPEAFGDINGFFAYHELDYLITQGVTALVKYDWQDPNASVRNDHLDRYTIGARFDPYTYLQVDLQYRFNAAAGDFGQQDFLFILRSWL